MLRFLTLAALVALAFGHGRVWEPVGRATMWRQGYITPANYDDNGLNCGGYNKQFGANGGLCGICGDDYSQATPRSHELGGTYGTGIIVAKYKAGQIIEATVEITAYHKGYWFFKICPDPSQESDQACFDKYLLELEEGGQFYYPQGVGTYTVRYRLPDGLTCDHCILQWFYVAGNNWGVCRDGTGALGCGDQEHFGSCSDISIEASSYVEAESIPLEIS